MRLLGRRWRILQDSSNQGRISVRLGEDERDDAGDDSEGRMGRPVERSHPRSARDRPRSHVGRLTCELSSYGACGAGAYGDGGLSY